MGNLEMVHNVLSNAVGQSNCGPNYQKLQSSVNEHMFVLVANVSALSGRGRAHNKNSDAFESGTHIIALTNSRPVIMPKNSALPCLQAVFRRRNGPTPPKRSLSDSSSESVEASTVPYILEGPLIAPSNTPGCASQPWHYVFHVSAMYFTNWGDCYLSCQLGWGYGMGTWRKWTLASRNSNRG